MTLDKAQCCSPASAPTAQLTQGKIDFPLKTARDLRNLTYKALSLQCAIVCVLNAFIAAAGDLSLGSFTFTKQNYTLREHLVRELSLHRKGLTAVYTDVS